MSIRKVLFRVFVFLGLAACLWLAVIAISPQTGLYPLARTSPLIYLKLTGKGPTKLATLQHPDYITCVAFSPDGKSLLAAGSIDGTVFFWDMASRTATTPIKVPAQGVKCLAISPDGKRLATLCRDGTGKLWDLASNKQRATLTGENDCIVSVAFGPDSNTLAWTSVDRTIQACET